MILPGARDIAVSTEDTAYPISDYLRFDGRPEVVYVYLRVEDLTAHGHLEARVERTARTSVIGRLLGGDEVRVEDLSENPLGTSGGGASGVLKFAVRPGSGKRLPAGNYTVEVYNASGGAGQGGAVARKYFVVGD